MNWKRFKAKWGNCKRCPLAKSRGSIVLARGKLPCDVLLIGEAPGFSEDVLGRPFVGPAGKLLDNIIADATDLLGKEPRIAITNLVCCIPLDPSGSKTSEPEHWAIKACTPRLNDFISVAKPKTLIAVGSLAEKWLPKTVKGFDQYSFYAITHPAALLRMAVVQRGLAIQTCVTDLYEAFAESLEDGESNG